MTLKYCGGNSLMAEAVFGWGRQTVARGLGERRTGIMCLGAHAAFSGRQRWEEQHPHVAQALRQLAEAHAQKDPTFRTCLAYTRLTAQAALEALRDQGDGAEQLPSPSPMAAVLKRMGFRRRKVVKAKPQKKSKETDAIFDNIKKRRASHRLRTRHPMEGRWSSDGEDRRVFARGSHPRRPPGP
jgi:hypothetical protein